MSYTVRVEQRGAEMNLVMDEHPNNRNVGIKDGCLVLVEDDGETTVIYAAGTWNYVQRELAS